MTAYLLDTNVLCELRRPKPNARVVAFVAAQPLEELYVSSVTFAEIRFGIESLPEPKRRAELTTWLAHQVRPMFGQRVLDVNEDVIFTRRVLVEHGRKGGDTLSPSNLIIGASALRYGLTLVTRNVDDYAPINVPLLNPWTHKPSRPR